MLVKGATGIGNLLSYSHNQASAYTEETGKNNYMLPIQSPYWTIDVCQQNVISSWH